jgi:hypothetical protein
MPSWFVKLADIVWTSVFALTFAVASVITSIVAPSDVALVISFAGFSVTLALLAQRD